MKFGGHTHREEAKYNKNYNQAIYTQIKWKLQLFN